MLPLRSLVNDELSKHGISRVELVRRLGYRNENKGLRRFDDLLENLWGNEDLIFRIQDVLGIAADLMERSWFDYE